MIRTVDIPTMSSTLREIISDDLPRAASAIASSVTSEAQQTRTKVIERSWVVSSEINNLKTALGSMLLSERANIQATLLPPIKQHMDGLANSYVQELRSFRSQLGPTNISTDCQSSESSSAQSSGSRAPKSNLPKYMRTKQTAAVRWEGRLPLGIGSFILRREVRQRILIRVRKYITEKDTSIDTETRYILGFLPSPRIFGTAITGCNWKFSFKTTRRISADHGIWGAIKRSDMETILRFFTDGQVLINDVDDSDGKSLLHYAAESYDYNICAWLVDNGIDSYTFADNRQTALYEICYTGIHEITEGYDQVVNLLVERCQLDPNDKDLDGRSVLETAWKTRSDSFSRLLKLSLPLCTEPEGYRIKELFHSIAAYTDQAPPIDRLKVLLDAYEHTGLPLEDNDGMKWWHTNNYLWRLVECSLQLRAIRRKQNSPSMYASDSLDEQWIEEQICEVIRSGIDLHIKVGKQTLVDFITTLDFDAAYLGEPGNIAHLRDWLMLLHKAGTVSIADYLRQEEWLRRGGEIAEESHYYQEYPLFTIRHDHLSNSIEFTRAVAILKPVSTPPPMPGAWQSDAEMDYCERQEFRLRYRSFGGHTIPIATRWDDEDSKSRGEDESLAVFDADPSQAIPDTTIRDWEILDGRQAVLYPLWTISTAGFDSSDYSLKAAVRFKRDYRRNPIWIGYPWGWMMLRNTCDWKPPPEHTDVTSTTPSEPQTSNGFDPPYTIVDLQQKVTEQQPVQRHIRGDRASRETLKLCILCLA